MKKNSLNNVKELFLYYVYAVIEKLTGKYQAYNYRKKTLLSKSEFNEELIKLIEEGTPFSVVRPGLVEASSLPLYDEKLLFHNKRYMKSIFINDFLAGGNDIDRFMNGFKKTLLECDYFASVGEMLPYAYISNTYAYNSKNVNMDYINPIGDEYDESWISSLKGKRVLVVSAFSDEMEYQYPRMKLIWGDKKTFPECDLIFQKAVWYDSKRKHDFESWFAAAEFMLNQIKEKEFDVALLCCSYFSFYLAYHLKKMGKQAIQFGGDFQLMFGIMGSRWENNTSFNKYVNEYWIRPFKESIPAGLNGEEYDKGCYW